MARIEIRPDLIASRYDGLPGGPRLAYSFESQQGLPVDSTSPLLRSLSPFTLRIVPPSLVEAKSDKNVNLIGSANASMADQEASARGVRSLFGANSVTGSEEVRLGTLQRIVSAGQVTRSAVTETERAVLVDLTTVADIAFQVEQIQQTPPLTLLINPSEMNTTYSQLQQHSNRTRRGFLIEAWGETQPTITFSGSTGGFIAAANPAASNPRLTETPTQSGLQYASKRDSAAWQNFTSLLHFYRNNGYIYDTVGGTEAHLMVGAIAIDYDQFTYVGHIESFDFSYTEENPHRVEWSMEFIVDRMLDLAGQVVTVQPHTAPQPNPSDPGRPAQGILSRPDGLDRGFVNVSSGGNPKFAHTPMSLLGPSGTTG